MQSTHNTRPNARALTRVLDGLIRASDTAPSLLEVTAREPMAQGTFPKEVVTCKLDDGRELRLFCKYAVRIAHEAYGHRGGVEREISVYQQILQPLRVSVPKVRGVHVDKGSDQLWLVLEYLNGAVRVKKSTDPGAMSRAARWIADFHAATERELRDASYEFLEPYDAEYYVGWARRTVQHADHGRSRFPWLKALVDRFEQSIDKLVSGPRVVVHGEYYPKNIMYRDGTVFPVDWESTAIGAGEIDLASLTEAWPDDDARDMERHYVDVRWPDGAPAEFRDRLEMARLYLDFRWLGDRPEWTTSDGFQWRFENLRVNAERLGLL